MTEANNPFSLTHPRTSREFCNRVAEQKELQEYCYARSSAVVVAARRTGKTALVKKVCGTIESEGGLTFYMDFLKCFNLNDVASTMYRAMNDVVRKQEGLGAKAMRLLRRVPIPLPGPNIAGDGLSPVWTAIGTIEDPMSRIMTLLEFLRAFVEAAGKPVLVVMDEFQQILELPEGRQLEAVFREHHQGINGGFLFVGSRRHLLVDMFSSKKRPFYQSAILYRLPPFPIDELEAFVVDRFATGGVACPGDVATRLVHLSGGYIYYLHQIGIHAFRLMRRRPDAPVTVEVVEEAYRLVHNACAPEFLAEFRALSSKQGDLLRAIAHSPTGKPYDSAFIRRHRLGAVSTVQRSMKPLLALDHIEQREDSVYQVTDPLFAAWLRGLG